MSRRRRRSTDCRALKWALSLAVCLFVAAGRSGAASAQPRVCNGPPECCAAERATAVDAPQEVTLGVVLMGLHNVDERAGTWDADYYLYESWRLHEGFTPQTEVTDEVRRVSEQYDTIWPSECQCLRSRRVRSTVHSAWIFGDSRGTGSC